MIDEDWQGFASAFSRAVRPDDASGRSGRRMLVIGFAVVVAAAFGALLVGALGGGTPVASASEVKPITPTPPANAGGPPQPGTSFTAVAGPGCASDATAGFTAYGYYTGINSDQTTGWSSSDSGGYNGGSCTGGFLSIPVSGQASAFDDSRFALWKFDFSKTFTSASCTLESYVPDNPNRELVGGDPAYFYYYQVDYAYGSTGSPLGGYLVSQVSKRGQWVVSKAFTVRTGKVTVKLVDAGARDNAAAKDSHVAAAQVRITCHAV